MSEEGSGCELFNKFVNQVQRSDFVGILARAEQKYCVRQFKISQITPVVAGETYHSIFIKYLNCRARFRRSQNIKNELNWWQNQLRMFIWVLVCYIQLRGISIESLGSSDWQLFSKLFPHKKEILFEYQSINLLKEHGNARKWTSQEDELFADLIQSRDQKYKWSELAKELYINSDRRYFRTPKQCRERWLNHLDPCKSKKEWELKEDFVLITHVRTKGKKWAQISKLLRNRRNQHSIKNRYKSLLTKQQKLHSEILPETVLVEHIFKKYEHHFGKLRSSLSSLTSIPSQQQLKYEDEEYQNRGQDQLCLVRSFNEPREESPLRQHQSQIFNRDEKRLFQIQPCSSFRSFQKIEQPIIQQINQVHSVQALPSIQMGSEMGSPLGFSGQQNLNSVGSFRSLAVLEREQLKERQKQIRADIFLADDPFQFLKVHFRSKDSITQSL